ncbi:MAG: response regulator [Paludibacteraceae bacterium]
MSIIIASVEMLAKHSEPKGEEEETRQTIKRSATRLLFLVNQLMDFRKIESDHAVVNLTKGNVIDFFNQIINVYRPLFTKKKINLSMKVSYTETELFFDFDKLEKILTNLLTNAVKYTPQHGIIEFSLNIGRNIVFSVKDSGNGLSEKQKGKIFEAFYSENFSNDLVESSGIGLALTASLVKLLNGEITVESEPGKGAKFIVTLPYSLSEEETTDNDESTKESSIDLISGKGEHSFAETNETNEKTEVQKEYTIVIAEDNKDLLMLLQKNFNETYKTKCFENGKDAWEYINKKTPDILITDIMMPVMSGTELCQRIKTDINLCHIPVIMLTAKTSNEAKLEGLQMGADEYIYKPFSMEELEIRINNILNAQRVLKNRLLEISRLEGIKIPQKNHDQVFMEKILALIQENIENTELDVQYLADKLYISRSSLHNKIKNLMDMNTSEFINTVRINKAKELILYGQYTLSEISYKVGYNDAPYFTRVFKKITGVTPKEFKTTSRESASEQVK